MVSGLSRFLSGGISINIDMLSSLFFLTAVASLDG